MAQSVIVIDATISGANSNSFIDLAAMETLIHQRPFHSAWDKINNDDEKKAALIWATTILSHLKWDGLLTSSDQALAFPRSGLYDYNSRQYDENAHPNWLVLAFVELTFVAATKDILSDSDTAGLKGVKLGSLALTIDTEYKQEVIPTYIMDAIKPWLSTEYGANSMKLGRA